MTKIDEASFMRGARDVLTFRPIREWLGWRVDHFLSFLYVRKLWGERCSDFEPECVVCQRWQEHDELFNED